MKTVINTSLVACCFILLLTSCQKAMFNPKSADYAPIVELETTMGKIQIQLLSNTPKHRDNFLKLVKEGFYDSLLFHRVIPEFMIQGGDPESKNAAEGTMLGMGGPGYTIPAEFVDENVHIKGMLAAARQGDQVNPKKESSGSQFYIVQGKKVDDAFLDRIEQHLNTKYTAEQRQQYKEIGGTPHLDRAYTVFGKVVEGMDVLDKISAAATDPYNRPTTDIRIIKAKLVKG